jgi:hypothetical protein
VIVLGSLPVLSLNIIRVARREWKRHGHVDDVASQTLTRRRSSVAGSRRRPSP